MNLHVKLEASEIDEALIRAVIAEAKLLAECLTQRLCAGNLSSQALGELVELSYLLEPLAKAARRHGLEQAQAGTPPVGCKLVAAPRRRTWANPVAVIEALRKTTTIRLSEAVVPLSPYQLERRFGAELYAKFKDFVTLAPARTRLAPLNRAKSAIAVEPAAPTI